jgi:hypothetical protein
MVELVLIVPLNYCSQDSGNIDFVVGAIIRFNMPRWVGCGHKVDKMTNWVEHLSF